MFDRMQQFKTMLKILALIALTALLGELLIAWSGENTNDDWPQWRGPNRDGISAEKGILKSWPESGPEVLWRLPVGEGFSSMSVSNGKLFTMWDVENSAFLVCLNASNGKEFWRYKVGRNYRDDQGDGPRACPTIDGNLVYAIGAKGNLHAVNVENGTKVWSHDLVKEYGSRIPRWGYSSSPLVEGEKLLVEVGGKAGHAFIAFNKNTGNLIWASQTDRPGYSSPLAVSVNGIRQIIFFSASGLFAVSPEDGKLFWHYPWTTEYDANIAIPILIAPDKIFISSNYGVGATVVQIKENSGKFKVETVWKNRRMKNHFNTSVLHENYIYGFDNRILKCIDAKTGEDKWKTRGFQKGSLLFVDGHLIVLGERGRLALVEANPSEYREKSSLQMLNGKCWTMPTLAGGKLYLRNQKEMLCLDVTNSSQ